MNTAPPLAHALSDAARLVARVAAGRSMAEVFDSVAERSSETPRGALLDLTNGTLRRYGRMPAMVRQLSRHGGGDPLIEALLWCALYALESGRYAEYTVVDQAVRAAGLLEKRTAKGYVNGLLRAYLRERGAVEARVTADSEGRYQHPDWWIKTLRAAYPSSWEDILAAGNSHPPMGVRVNRRRLAPADFRAKLEAEGISFRQLGDESFLLERPVPVERLPGFAQGEVSVQDAGAQRAARCLDLAAGQRVLDACAAPGGKTAHILEHADVELTALDSDAGRCAQVVRNLERLNLRADVRTADCTQLAQWWDGRPFDRILADVPCSASGIVRRHPDVKWLRRAKDVAGFAARQAAILDALWRALAPNGKLLYVTCSLFPQENQDVVEAFLARESGARRLELPDGGSPQLLPVAEHDGFYYALIEKQA